MLSSKIALEWKKKRRYTNEFGSELCKGRGG
jgi:hypothetical protein